MSAYPQTARISAYQSVAAHGTSSSADPHQLITLLMDGALDRLASANGCIERGEVVQKAALLQRVGAIIEELRSSLDHSVGGEVAGNLDRLYDYMMRRVLVANLHNETKAIDEVARLLREIRTAWVAIPLEARHQRK